MDDADSIDLSDTDEFMLDIEINPANVQDAINMVLAEDDSNSNLPTITTNIDLPPLSDELINFDGNKFGEELLQKTDLEKILFEHWKTFVPQCYVYHTQLIKGIIEQRTQEILFRPLDIYLYGTLNTDEAIEKIRSFNKQSTVCGHLFKAEEPTYFCRDCCIDPTCVLCTDCFLQSEHRNHRYKMNVSAGGGYCDCGDSEAWKQHVHCSLHLPRDDSNESSEEILNRLPVDLRQRAKQLFHILLCFIIKLLFTEKYQEIPNELKNEFWDGDHKRYVTMLFNDEVHTYDQVINVLSRAIQCTKQEGHEFASLVDREGRTVIRIGTVEQCREAQQTIRIRTADNPLKCEIYPSSFISLQYFAQKLLSYLQDIISVSDGFRRLFCESEMERDDQQNIVLTEKVLLGEKMVWKSARSALHQIFINSFFMDAEWKKTFAILYMKNYSTVWLNFVKDPDEYVSFTDLSVQIYTVPTLSYSNIAQQYRDDSSVISRTDCFLKLSVQILATHSLARYLISSHNAFQIIIDSFLKYCQSKLDHDRLVFSRTTNTAVQHEFRRAQSILYDLRYLLGVVPDQYTPELRENFINGLQSFLQLLKYMHGMDKVTRQVGQHIEFDPEWETAFNLVIKIQAIIASILDWCSHDAELLNRAYEVTGSVLAEVEKTSDVSHLIKDKTTNASIVKTTVRNLKVDCFAYDVAKDPITVHIPVVRLFAALHVHLQKYTDTVTKFNNLCEKYQIHPCFVYEESLRIQVLTAQHEAGLWKRNGHSLSNQIHYYSNVKCRKEMYDRDILALQVGASFTPADTFLIQLLHKFSLLDWVRTPENGHLPDADSRVKEKVRVMEEFLHLLIIIINERYEPSVGKVTNEQKLTREVIHQLCISPMAHSELIRGLQDCGQLETGLGDLESILKEVADFKRGTATKGNYELKTDRLMDYNQFYYHYTKAEQCKSEEYIIKRRKLNNDGSAVTLLIPCPPLFTDAFHPIIHLLDSDIFLTLLKGCLYRPTDPKALFWSETILNRALHLLTLALYEQEREPNFEFYSKCQKFEFDNLFNQLHLKLPSKAEICRELLNHTNKHYKKFDQTNEQINPSSTISTHQEVDDVNKRANRKRKDLAGQKRAKMIAQMTELQKNFIEKNIHLCLESMDEQSSSDLQILSTSPNTTSKFEPMIIDETSPVIQSCLGTYDTDVSQFSKQSLICIFCQENSEVKLNADAIVLPAYVQNSRVLSKNRSRRIENWDAFDPTFMSTDLHWGVHVSSCGHAIHASCWTKYHNSITSQDHRRTLRIRGSANYDTDRNEFLCPLCQTLSNTTIPVLPSLRTFAPERKLAQMTFSEWLDGLEKALNGSIESRYEIETHEEQLFFNPCPLTSITKMMAERAAQNFQLLFGFAGDSRVQDFSDGIRERLLNFGKNVYAYGLNVDPDDDNDRVPLIIWTACAYTIQSIEQVLRIDSKSIFSQLSIRQSELINCLTKVAAVYGLLNDSEKIRKHCLKLLSVLLFSRTNIQIPSLADIDLFHLLISICFTLPILFASKEISPSLTHVPTGNLNDLYLMRLIFMAHCIQILSSEGFLFENNDTSQQQMKTDTTTNDNVEIKAIQKLIEKITKNQTSASSSNQMLSLEIICDKLKQSVLPLLRCSALFYHHLTGTSWPIETDLDEYSAICRYLGLPTCLSELLDTDNERCLNDLINNWISNLSTNKSLVKYPIAINELYSLPKEYIDLMNQVSQGVAPYKYARDEIRSPCICLVCGEVVVRSSSTSTPNPLSTNGIISSFFNIDHTGGPCNLHTQQCCGTNGLYLRVKECSLLLLNINHYGRSNKTRGTLLAAPYLDDYGETDQNLRRGNPLHLCEERYRALHRRWLGHSIPEDISRNMEVSNTLVYGHNWSQF